MTRTREKRRRKRTRERERRRRRDISDIDSSRGEVRVVLLERKTLVSGFTSNFGKSVPFRDLRADDEDARVYQLESVRERLMPQNRKQDGNENKHESAQD